MKSIEEALKSNYVLTNVRPSTIDALTKASRLKRVKKGEYVFRDKDYVDEIYFVSEGSFSLYKLNSLGEKKVMFVLNEGTILNEIICSDLPCAVSCNAFSDGLLICVPKATLSYLMSQDPELMKAVIAKMEIKIRRLYRQLKNTTGSVRMDKRLASKLYKLARDYGVKCDKGILIDLELSNTYLADLLGTKRETISRQMKILIDEGLISQNKQRIIIISEEKLRDYFQI